MTYRAGKIAIVALLAVGGWARAVAAPAPMNVSGVWQVTRYVQELRTLEGDEPPLKPGAAEIYRKNRARMHAGDLSFDPSARCKAVGMPRFDFLPYPMQIIQRSHVVVFLSEWQRSFRRADLTGGHAEVDYPLPRGVSTGRIDGDTLVIETVGLVGDTLLDASGMPHSEDLKLTERYRLLNNGSVLQNVIRIDDPQTFTRAWETSITYRRLPPGTELKEDVCIDRYEAGRPAIEPLNAPGAPTTSTARAAPLTAFPSFEGTWQPVFLPPPVKVAIGSGVLRTVQGDLPPYTPAAETVFRRRIELEQKGTPLANVDNTCRPHHMIIDLVLWLAPFEIVQTRDQMTFLFEASNSHLTIRLDRGHPHALVPSYRGDAIGHWEGSTLVVETLGFNGKSWLDPSGTPASAQMRWVTRIEKDAAGKRLTFTTAVHDPQTFERAWSTVQTAEAKPDARILETDCLENVRAEANQQIIYEDWKPPFWDPRTH